jgi:hypothetical protein
MSVEIFGMLESRHEKYFWHDNNPVAACGKTLLSIRLSPGLLKNLKNVCRKRNPRIISRLKANNKDLKKRSTDHLHVIGITLSPTGNPFLLLA